jgi:hypothetical protein
VKAILCSVLMFFCLGAKADVLQVDVNVTFVGQYCVGCVEYVSASVQFDPTRPRGGLYNLVGDSIPGTFSSASSGFLGDFNLGNGYVRDDWLLSIGSNFDDELDIGMPLGPGQYSLGDFRAYLWGCWSQECLSAYDPMPFFIQPAYAEMSVWRVREPSALALAFSGLTIACVMQILPLLRGKGLGLRVIGRDELTNEQPTHPISATVSRP